jgi:hypothetical protein
MSLKLKKQLCTIFSAALLLGGLGVSCHGIGEVFGGVNRSIGFSDVGTAFSAVAAREEGAIHLVEGLGILLLSGMFSEAASAYQRRLYFEPAAPRSRQGGLLRR